MGKPQASSPEKDQILERYTRLSHHSAQLRHRLDNSASTTPSPYSSPQQTHPTFPPYPSPVNSPTPTSDSTEDEALLYEVDNQIKTTLTELLNCESVKHDKTFRAWVQSKLMDAEHELKQQRRRRSITANETMRAFGGGVHYGNEPATLTLRTAV
ncbi:hypothetical protein EJ08DRAFT_645005 [Tothia fuscella]|uniref:Uncharacterized protein n=1 Tax=Tothia fuscella TaxID=1048955 RepID=A0A9P4U4D9_9PEZI|nr:hypothetical protein EJ08DRAFT_645005 [Tothia fuscella]